jgi:hypothetical protein
MPKREFIANLSPDFQSNESGHFLASAVIIGVAYRKYFRPPKFVDEDEVWNIEGKTV